MAATPNGFKGFASRVAVRGVLSLLLLGGFVWALQRGGLPLAPENAFGRVTWWGIPGFLVLVTLAAFLRTRRWFYLLQPLAPRLRPWRVFGMGLLGFCAIFFAPLRLGEFVRPYLVSRDGEVSFTQAVGTVAAERIIDGLVMVALTALALATATPLEHLPDRLGSLPIPVSLVPRIIVGASITFVLAFAAMATFYLLRDTARRLVRAVLGVVSVRLADYCSAIVERLAESLGFLPSWKRLGPFLLDTFLYWGAMALGQYTLLRGVGLASDLSQAGVTVGVASLGSLLPAGPGFFGPFQLATYTSLAMFHSEADVLSKGAVFVFLSYACSLAINAVQGVVGVVLLSRVPAARAAQAD
jgi:uncharacterized membrane protein YbhN (UPF0104 family)